MSTTTYEMLAVRITTLEEIISKHIANQKPDKSRKSSPKDSKERKKRPLSAYQLFCNAKRSEVQDRLIKNLEEGSKLPRGAALAELGKLWKELGDDEKKTWEGKRDSVESKSEDDKSEPESEPEPELKIEPEVDTVPTPKKEKKEKKENKEKKEKKNSDGD